MDVNFKRLSIMTDLLKRCGASCIELVHQDFLTVEAGSTDASNVDYILMDPTCSGSGKYCCSNLLQKIALTTKKL